MNPPFRSPEDVTAGVALRREPVWLAAVEILLVAGLVAAPLLDDVWAALLVFLLSLAWLWTRTSRERRIAGPILAVAVAALIAGWAADRLERPARAERIRETRREYAEIWKDLRTEAHAAASVLTVPAETPAARLQAFSRLSRIEIGEGKGRRALMLLDPDGVPVAWAGEGLLHELPQELPRQGPYYRGSFSAMTLLVLEPLGDSRRPWRVVAGVSFPTDTLPFPRSRAARWTVVDNAAQAVPGADLVTLPGGSDPGGAAEPRAAGASRRVARGPRRLGGDRARSPRRSRCSASSVSCFPAAVPRSPRSTWRGWSAPWRWAG